MYCNIRRAVVCYNAFLKMSFKLVPLSSRLCEGVFLAVTKVVLIRESLQLKISNNISYLVVWRKHVRGSQSEGKF